MCRVKTSPVAQACSFQSEKPSERPQLPVKAVKNSPSVLRFKETARFIMDMMPRKSSGEVGVNRKYWLEVKDPKHRDRVSLSGFDGQSGALGAWKEDVSSNCGLFDWIDQHPDVEINTIKSAAKYPLSEKVGYVNYLSADQATHLQVTISQGEWTIDGKLLDTTSLPGKRGVKGHAAIVIHRDGRIFVNPHEKGKWHHTSTTEGRPVLSAGMILINQGQARSFHLNSGHYLPQKPQLENFLAQLKAHDVNISQLNIHARRIAKEDIKALIEKYSR